MANNYFSAQRIQDIMVYMSSHVSDLSKRGVQTMFLSNQASVTVELSHFSDEAKKLRTVSVIIFPGDYDKKYSFLKGVVERLHTDADPFKVVTDSKTEYLKQFIF